MGRKDGKRHKKRPCFVCGKPTRRLVQYHALDGNAVLLFGRKPLALCKLHALGFALIAVGEREQPEA